jgi:hypothetical protein
VLLGASDDHFIRHATGKTILALSEYFIFMGSVRHFTLTQFIGTQTNCCNLVIKNHVAISDQGFVNRNI